MTPDTTPSPGTTRGADDTRSLVEVTDVSRAFGDVVALDGVSLTIRENEFFALLGPSGCGKTTLLRILAGLDVPDSGGVTLDGDDLVAMPPHRRPINLMFQSYALFPHLNVEKNVAYGLQRERRPRDEVRERVRESLEIVGLSGFERRRPHELSGGQRQRVALARAMVKRPRLLLLDEPLAALDKKIRMQMQMELKRLQHEAGITFVVVTHDQEEAMSMADRIAVMNEGHVEQLAAPVDLYERPDTFFVADFIGSANFFTGVVETAGGRVWSADGFVLHTDVRGAADGEEVTVSVRPERMVIGPPPEGSDHLSGKVIDVQFYGGVSHCIVEVADRSTPVLVALQGSTKLTPGERVDVWWRSEDARVLGR